MKPSKQISNLTPSGSDGWEIVYESWKLAAAGEKIISLAVGEHDIPTSKPILDKMFTSAQAGNTGYTPVGGVPALRKAIANKITKTTGVKTGAENILVTPGGQFALFIAHMIALDPGDRALFLSPYYATYPGTIRSVGGAPIEIDPKPNSSFQPNLAEIAQKAKTARSLLINTPNNPSGAVYAPDTMESIRDICRAHDLWLISDEVYESMIWNGHHTSAWHDAGNSAQSMVVGSFSKNFAMTGSRLGWLCGPPDVIALAESLATHTTYGTPGYIQQGALHALALGEALEKEVTAPFERRRNMALELLSAHPDVDFLSPDGGMYLMLDIRKSGLSSIEFAHRLLHEHKIVIMPGDSFGKAARGYVRIAFTASDEQFAFGFHTIIKFLEDLASA